MEVPTKPQHYCLQWNNYTTHITDLFVQLLATNCLVDVTLCVEHKTIFAHRIILSACSTFFQEIFSNADDSHPIVILGEMKFDDVKAVVEFIYRGELSVCAEQVTSVLQVARELKVRGLMEVSGKVLDLEVVSATARDILEEVFDITADNPCDTVEVQEDDSHDIDEEEELPSVDVDYLIEDPEHPLGGTDTDPLDMTLSDGHTFLVTVDDEEKISKPRRETSRKSYSDVVMNEALNEIRSGRSLQEISESRNIPRSTLYFRARIQGVPISCPRQEYSQEKVNAAMLAITDGCSLLQAAQQYNIPKTVLWRRIQKERPEYRSVLQNRRKSRHDAARKQAAIQALENGVNISKVSSQFSIPKVTLFREKCRLVEAGRLPLTSLRRRNQTDDGFKQQRLAEAVAACKGGKMSQAAASNAYKVPKTTIWRRLRAGKEKSKEDNKLTKEIGSEFTELIETEEIQETKFDDIVVQLPDDTEFSIVAGDSSEMPVTYMDESDFADASLIILASGRGGETISLPVHESQVIVDSDDNQVLERE